MNEITTMTDVVEVRNVEDVADALDEAIEAEEPGILDQARADVDELCQEKGWDLRKTSDWGRILNEIDRRHDKRHYKCRYCWDSGIVSWIDPDDGMFYGRRCGFCRYWDEQREKARGETK